MTSRQPWTSLEDQILSSLVKKYGVGNWVLISEKMQQRANTHSRSGKQCRQRWHNHLDPQVIKKSWTLQQQKLMFQSHKKHGNKWSDIASELVGRTDSDVKNHFYSIIRKCLRRLSKMVGQKNSTQKIRNVKPSVLSKLLQSNNEKSKETSDALFKFILQRQNLNFKSLDKKTRDTLQNLVDKIVTINDQRSEIVNSFTSENQNERQEQNNDNNIQIVRKTSRVLRSSIQIKPEKDIKRIKSNKQKKIPKTKKIKKEVSIKDKRRNSKVSTTNKQNKSNQSNQNIQFQIDLPTIPEKKPSVRVDSRRSDRNSDGFRPFDMDENDRYLSRKSSRSRESILSDLGIFQDISMPQFTWRRSPSVRSENRQMMSNTENYTSFSFTPTMPTPGFNGNLFETFSKLSPGQLTLGDLESDLDGLRKRIQRNQSVSREDALKDSLAIDLQ